MPEENWRLRYRRALICGPVPQRPLVGDLEVPVPRAAPLYHYSILVSVRKGSLPHMLIFSFFFSLDDIRCRYVNFFIKSAKNCQTDGILKY